MSHTSHSNQSVVHHHQSEVHVATWLEGAPHLLGDGIGVNVAVHREVSRVVEDSDGSLIGRHAVWCQLAPPPDQLHQRRFWILKREGDIIGT